MEIDVRVLKTSARPPGNNRDDSSPGSSEEELITSLIVPIPSSSESNNQSGSPAGLNRVYSITDGIILRNYFSIVV